MTKKVVTFAKSVDSFLLESEASRGYTDETIRSYKSTLGLTMDILGRDIDPRSIDEEDLHVCLVKWKNLSTSTRAIRISVWHSYFKWLSKKHGCPDPSILLERPRKQTPDRKRISPKEFRALLAAAERPSDKLLILTLGHTGIRRAEFLALTWGDVDIAERRLSIRLGKGRKGRSVPISLPLAAFLVGYKPADAKDGDRLVDWGSSNPGKRIRLLATRTGYHGPLGNHDFRRFCLREVMAKSKDIRVAQQIGGHASIETTRKYTGPVDDAVLKDSIDGAFSE